MKPFSLNLLEKLIVKDVSFCPHRPHGIEMVKKMDEHQAINANSALSAKRRYYWINLAGVSLGVLCFLTSYSILFFIQSSLYSKDGLGTTALSVDYASQVISCFFLPPFLMRTIGCKWSLVVSGVCIAFFIATNLKASFATLIPASIFLGIGLSNMWATMNTIVCDLAIGYAKLTETSETECLSRFFSIFFSVILSASIWGNIISSQILSPGDMLMDHNDTLSARICGAQYCDSDVKNLKNMNSSPNSTRPTDVPYSEIVNLVTTGLGTVALGIIFILAMLRSYNPQIREVEESAFVKLVAGIRLLRKPNLLLLIVLTITSGLMFSFLSADFTKAFVTCSMGIHNVGWVLIFYGIAVSVSTFILIYAAPFLPRVALFLGAATLNMVDLFIMLFWTPDPQSPAVYYFITAVWGLTFSVWVSQLCAFYGVCFPRNHREAYSNHRVWECVGFVIGFAWSYNLCMYIKIYLIQGFLAVGTVGYLLVEKRLRLRRI